MIQLNNEFLSVQVHKKGAELSSLKNKVNSLEYMWQGDPAYWPWHAPTLFPIVGAVKDNLLSIEGQVYNLPRHGFARHSAFTIIESSNTHAIFSLRYSQDTLAIYPYRFELQILYSLDRDVLSCTYKIINLDEQTIWFSIGGHPAFNVPFFPHERYEDYYIEFPLEESLIQDKLSSEGYFTGQQTALTLDQGKLWLTQQLFNEDALIFKTIKNKRLTIRSKNHPYSLTISFSDFKSLGIWAKPGAPFVCIEPWLGYADPEQGSSSIQEKEGITSLAHGHVLEAKYTLSF